jgi:hypothetical protein
MRKQRKKTGSPMLVRIKFPGDIALRKGLGFLMGRFSGSVFRSGEVIVSGDALPALANENFSLTVLGKITPEERAAKFRAAALAASKK